MFREPPCKLRSYRSLCQGCERATDEIRTRDLLFTRELLYQLSYGGVLPKGQRLKFSSAHRFDEVVRLRRLRSGSPARLQAG
jgi:hypothetical protein